jgi:DNA-binding NarL/FixJ family response regulator
MIRLAIVEDEQLLRQGLMSLFCAVQDFEVVAGAESEADLLQSTRLQEIDVVVTDVFDAGSSDLETRRADLTKGVLELMSRLPHARFVSIDDKASGFRLTQAISYGFSGCISKFDSFEEIVKVIRSASRRQPGRTDGDLTMSISFVDVMRTTATGLSILSPRELEVMRHIVKGLTVNRCAEALAISPSTVDNHKSSIMRKLAVHKISDLVRLAVREGLISAKHA